MPDPGSTMSNPDAFWNAKRSPFRDAARSQPVSHPNSAPAHRYVYTLRKPRLVDRAFPVAMLNPSSALFDGPSFGAAGGGGLCASNVPPPAAARKKKNDAIMRLSDRTMRFSPYDSAIL